MSWSEDDLLWEKLDDVIMNGYADMKSFLDTAAEYKSDLGMINSTLLFGGIGQFYVTYVESRTETNSPKHSLANAVESVMNNPLVTKLMMRQVGGIFDKKVEELK
tara:strand:+ start:1554 stop:1868 length:315 start_codon:yes stop_codon:yes gene_type:complete